MAQLITVFWRDIPAQVIAKAGRATAKIQLHDRFQEAIDRAAMKAKMYGTDDYLLQWRRAAPEDCGDDLDAAAKAAAERLEAQFDDARLAALVASVGVSPEE
jgi:hypothetical protein